MRHDYNHVNIAKELIKKDILVIGTEAEELVPQRDNPFRHRRWGGTLWAGTGQEFFSVFGRNRCYV
ncbi:MAG: hypothetical protein J7M03_04315 [Candidatus Desulfofervidaceae bacterium]|nr:hypothetical protein [Candidatus Desulfofervidaceae bacterium]